MSADVAFGPGEGSNADLRPRSDPRWFRIVVMFLPLWAMGLGFIWWFVAAALAPRDAAPHRFEKAAATVALSLGVWLLLSAIVGLISGENTWQRSFGAFFSAAVWIAVAFASIRVASAGSRGMESIVWGLGVIAVVQGTLTAGAAVLHSASLASFDLPASHLLQSVSSLQGWEHASFAATSYFGESAVRSSGLMGSAAWTGGWALMVLLVFILCCDRLVTTSLRLAAWVIVVLCAAISLYYSLARVSWALFVASIVVYGVLRIGSRIRGGFIASILLTLIVILLSLSQVDWPSLLAAQNDLRPGSSALRFSSYVAGLNKVASGGPLVWLTGLGAKPQLLGESIGAGSESTIVSIAVRGGLVALILFLALLIFRARVAIQFRDWVSLLLVIVVGLHAFVEDLDLGTQTLLFLFLQPRLLRSGVANSISWEDRNQPGR